jgi:membrane peptidoglycan carboxypeptidase
MARLLRWYILAAESAFALSILALLALAGLVLDEMASSRWQARALAPLARELGVTVQPGPSSAVRPAGSGPFDQRLGYAALPQWQPRLAAQGFDVAAQARWTPRLLEVVDHGLYPVYREKTQAGLELRDCRGESLVRARYPQRVYPAFEAVPPLLVDALLYIENRELLDPRVTRNPAIEWDRFAKAVFDQALRRLVDDHAAAGGSTLATQIEKYRHSPEGRTDRPEDKLRQMATATLRAYLDGEDTRAHRRRIVLDYLNTVPLSAQGGFGEVNGLGDALWAWYGRAFDDVNGLLAQPLAEPPRTRAPRRALAFREALLPLQALAFKQALSLMVAQRRPSYYLARDGQQPLRELTDTYLRRLGEAGVLPAALVDAALPLALALRPQAPAEPVASFVDRKAANALRGRLQGLLGVRRLYDLERLDLTADASPDAQMQRNVSAVLRSLGTPEGARAAGLYGHHLFADGDDTGKIDFSFTLYERMPGGNRLRVQTDNLDQPFDLNEGARLDLGSTAKLRTLATYLEQLAALHAQWQGLDAAGLEALAVNPRDALALWARNHLAQAARTDGERGLAAMLEAAMLRTYPADNAESFYTGGGEHHFDNFDAADNGRTLTVRESFARSVNLPFIRLMRDVVRHVMATQHGNGLALLDDRDDPRRQAYLARFADREGSTYVARFWRKYEGRPPDEAQALLLQGVRPSPSRLAAAFFGLEPQAGPAALARFLRAQMPDVQTDDDLVAELDDRYRAGRWSLQDRGYIAGVHPLELWVAAWLRAHPKASLAETLTASREQRQEVYEWLFKTRRKDAQDQRIRSLLEIEAFLDIHRSWQRLGYPFESLTPSYATALGAAGDRPSALAELMGIIANDGLRLPARRLEALHVAVGTPWETHFAARAAAGDRVMAPEVAATLRRALVSVVETGTAKRLAGAVSLPDGSPVAIGGKTGTGDHRREVYGRGGQLIASQVVSRSATLVFLLGERHYGVLMAYARGADAEHFSFTSALPSQLLKALLPTLQPLLAVPGCEAVEPPRLRLDAAVRTGTQAEAATATRQAP